MPRRQPPRYLRNMVADHLRRDHHIPTLDPGDIGMRTSRRRPVGVRWADDPTDPLGAWFRCEPCRLRHGEGWERYYAAVYWPWPLAHHLDAIAAHYHEHHPGLGFDPGRVGSPGDALAEWQASFLPLTPWAPAGFLCDACRPPDEPRLAPRIVIGTDAYGDARRLRALRTARTDLHSDLAGRSPLQQAELLEARDRGLVLANLHPTAVHTALANARHPNREADADYLEVAMITLLREARDRGDQPTPVIKRLARLAKEHPRVFTTTVGRAIPLLAAQHARQTPSEFRRSVRTLLGSEDAPFIGERRLWDIWRLRVRDAD
jgi:hypothetical protein